MTRRDVCYDVVVIGAGAAGMMCAATSGLRQRRVLLIEHYPVLGEKIRISGGGRCNFTNINAGPANFLSRNPDFCKSALARYTPRDFVALVERYRIGYHEKKLGQLFCDDTARDLIAMLKAECDRGNVEWRSGHVVLSDGLGQEALPSIAGSRRRRDEAGRAAGHVAAGFS